MLRVKNLSFGYEVKPVLKNLSFNISKGDNVSIIGASGCGKSTLLQSIYGLHHVDGKIFWKEEQLLGPNFNIVPGEDFMKYLAQDFDLMPPLSVAENVGKYLSNMYPRKKQQRVNELLELVEMRELARVKARMLSGGQQQRVALARVLAKPPEVLLLDEPFSHIDHFRKNKLRRNLFSHLRKAGVTVIVATHDSTDALAFADQTIAMKDGRIIQMGRPEELYNHPKNAYVASLFGEVNELPASLILKNQAARKKIIIYPHEVHLTDGGTFKAKVKSCFFKGNHFLTQVEMDGEEILLESSKELTKNKIVYLSFNPELLNARLK
ncbi:ABC transporter ATP-binding protein [Salinimicrobium oceani]|uniref:ABC transporter ATP-binding protein n=1 Tax=Salinimicrobium oceani TaxID=2722702 RepID=A0ABX1D018_9FLAO|nr:ABC transporter ATP-binding protein [Salinimicrobium oceani]NJW53841.1 ABC transporter ATP-binding protein [Salinimicrobium oceani]